MAIRLEFQVLVYPEDELWIAHCLETDVVAEGSTPFDSIKNLIDLLNFHVEYALEEGNLGSIFSPAPRELWAMYASAKDVHLRRKPRKTIPHVKNLRVRELQPA